MKKLLITLPLIAIAVTACGKKQENLAVAPEPAAVAAPAPAADSSSNPTGANGLTAPQAGQGMSAVSNEGSTK